MYLTCISFLPGSRFFPVHQFNVAVLGGLYGLVLVVWITSASTPSGAGFRCKQTQEPVCILGLMQWHVLQHKLLSCTCTEYKLILLILMNRLNRFLMKLLWCNKHRVSIVDADDLVLLLQLISSFSKNNTDQHLITSPVVNGLRNFVISRDFFVYAPSQWETMLQCNIVSHWLGAYTKRSLDIMTSCILTYVEALWKFVNIMNSSCRPMNTQGIFFYEDLKRWMGSSLGVPGPNLIRILQKFFQEILIQVPVLSIAWDFQKLSPWAWKKYIYWVHVYIYPSVRSNHFSGTISEVHMVQSLQWYY